MALWGRCAGELIESRAGLLQFRTLADALVRAADALNTEASSTRIKFLACTVGSRANDCLPAATRECRREFPGLLAYRGLFASITVAGYLRFHSRHTARSS